MKSKNTRLGSLVLAFIVTFTMVFGTTLSVSAADQSTYAGAQIQKHFLELAKKYPSADETFSYTRGGDPWEMLLRYEDGGGSGEHEWNFSTSISSEMTDVFTTVSISMRDYDKLDKVTAKVSYYEEGDRPYQAVATIDSGDYVPGKTAISWKWYDENDQAITRDAKESTEATSLFHAGLSDINSVLKNNFGKGLFYFGFEGFCPGHSYGSAIVIKKPTYAAAGKNLKICRNCGKETYVTVPKLVPPATKIVKLTKGKKKFTVKWSKKKKISGYQIRYSKKSSMKSAKKVSIYKASAASKTIKKLKKGKKYYVQVRTFKKYNGKYYYSKWSAKKSIKVK